MAEKLNLLQRINEVRKAIDYIQKDKSVSTGGGSYRAVTHDAVTGMVRQHMVKHGVIVFPFLIESTMVQPFQIEGEKTNKQFRYEATYDFTFYNMDDADDKLVVRIQAHAMDNADKAPGKALSYAAKYALLKVFSLESGEDEESRYQHDSVEDDLLTGYITELTEADSMDTLKAKFAVVYKATTAANDKDAQKAVTKAYNARKVSLTGAAQ